MFSFFSFLHFLLSYFSTTSKENGMMETGNSEKFFFIFSSPISALDKDWRQLGIYPPLFGLIGYSNF